MERFSRQSLGDDCVGTPLANWPALELDQRA
jgi:hypothetical protein